SLLYSLRGTEKPPYRPGLLLFIGTSMRCGVVIHPVFLFIGHAVATGNLACGTRPIAGAGQRSVTEGFGPVAPPVGVPLVDDHLHRHGTAPDTAMARGIVGRHRQASMSALAIDGQRWRHSIPRCRCRQLFSTPHQFQFADFIDVGSFKSRIRNSMPQPLDVVTDSELVFGVCSGANTDSKFSRYSADCSLDPQQVTQIGVAPFIEGTSQTDSRLDRSDSPRPGNLGVHPQFVRVFKV